jgi:glucose-1-phosphate thymidylyltransferase
MVNKGIILAGGRGTRLYPATIVIGKPLLPIYDKPMIYYSISILMQAGIRDICIVTNPHDFNLFEELLGDGSCWGIHIEYRIQHEARGIADVFYVAEDFIQQQPCALVLGDNIFLGSTWKQRLQQLQNQPMQGAHIFAHPVLDPERYGVVTLNEHMQPIQLIEKPNPAPSNLAVTGLYFYDAQATRLAHLLKPSARGELEITDLNQLYLEQNDLHLTILNAPDDEWFDIGTHDAMYQAIDKISFFIHNSGMQIGCIEEMAFLNGWIDDEQLSRLAMRFRHTAYGRYLEKYFQPVKP